MTFSTFSKMFIIFRLIMDWEQMIRPIVSKLKQVCYERLPFSSFFLHPVRYFNKTQGDIKTPKNTVLHLFPKKWSTFHYSLGDDHLLSIFIIQHYQFIMNINIKSMMPEIFLGLFAFKPATFFNNIDCTREQMIRPL